MSIATFPVAVGHDLRLHDEVRHARTDDDPVKRERREVVVEVAVADGDSVRTRVVIRLSAVGLERPRRNSMLKWKTTGARKTEVQPTMTPRRTQHLPRMTAPSIPTVET
jgi:hypothetical protein